MTKSFNVEIVNVCHHGLLINCSPETINLVPPQDEETLHGVLYCHAHDLRYQINIRLQRVVDTFAGLFAENGIPYVLLQHFVELAEEQNNGIRRENFVHDLSRQRLLAQQVLNHMQTYIYPTLSAFFGRANEILRNAAEQAQTRNRISRLYQLSEEITIYARGMDLHTSRTLSQEILSYFTQDRKTEINNFNEPQNDLALVETATFDRWMMTKALAQRIENHISEDFFPLIARLRSQYPMPENAPMLPRSIVRNIHEEFSAHHVDDFAQKILLDALSKLLIDPYKKLCKDLSETFSRAGYVSLSATKNLSTSLKKVSETSGSQTEAVSRTIWKQPIPKISMADSLAYLSEITRIQEKSEQSQAVLSSANTETKNYSTSDIVKKHLSTEELANRLFNIFQHNTIKNSYESSDSLHSIQLGRIITRDLLVEELELSVIQTTTIDLVDSLFDHIYNNHFLISGIRLTIDILRPLYAYDYVLTGTTFEHGSNLRQVLYSLQLLAHDELAWMPAQRNGYIAALKEFLPNDQFEWNANTKSLIFLKTLHTMLTHLENVRARSLARLQRGAEARYQLQVRRAHVQTFLLTFFNSEQRLPKWLDQLLRIGWSERLCIIASQEGLQGAEYIQAKDSTITFVNILKQTRRRQTSMADELADKITKIIEYLCDQLTGAGVKQSLIDSWQLKLSDMIAGHKNDFNDFTTPSLWFQESGLLNLRSLQTYSADRVSKLRDNDWLHCPQFGIEKRYLQVAWQSEDHSYFLLTNHNGVSVGEFTAQQLTELIETESIRPIAESMLAFLPVGIEQYFHRIYDRIGQGKNRDPLTGMMNLLNFEANINSLMSYSSQIFSVCILYFEQLEKLRQLKGEQYAERCTFHIANTIRELVEQWNIDNQWKQIDHQANLQQGYFGFVYLHQSKNGDFKKSLARFFLQFIQEFERSQVSVESETLVFQVRCGIALNTSKNISPGHQLVSLASIAAKEHDLSKDAPLNLVDERFIDRIKTIRDSNSWTLTAKLSDLTNKLVMEQSDIIDIVEAHQITQFYVDSNDQNLINLVQNKRGMLVNDWMISMVVKMLGSSSSATHPVLGHFVQVQIQDLNHNEFYQAIFEQLSKLNTGIRLHFCIEDKDIVDLGALKEFVFEMKSYGCEILVRNWVLSTHSFNLIQNTAINYYLIHPDLLSSENNQLLQALTMVAIKQDKQIIFPRNGEKNITFMSKFFNVAPENFFYEVSPVANT